MPALKIIFHTAVLLFVMFQSFGNQDDFFGSLEKREDISFLRGKEKMPYVHFFAAESEYGAFFSMPMLGKMLNERHGFSVSVSYSLDLNGSIDDRIPNGLVGFELMERADLVVVFTRSKLLTKSTASAFQKYLDSGKPLVGFRTANHGFNFSKEDPDADFLRSEGWTHKGPQLCSMWKHKFGGHHGGSPRDGMLTDIFPNSEYGNHPILNGIQPYKDPRHLYILLKEPGKTEYDFTPLVMGKARKIFDHKKHLPEIQPTVIISEKPRRTFYSSTCGADTFYNPNARRLALHGILWALGMEKEIPETGVNVDFTQPYAIPHDTHLRKGEPNRGLPRDVFKPRHQEVADIQEGKDYTMLLFPKEDKNQRIALLAETHVIKGGSKTPSKQPPVEYPYLSIYKGKAESPYKDYTEYKPRLFDFYARQGRFYLENPDKKKSVVPGFVDLDAGIHGHSGTYHKNGMSTPIRDQMEQGNVIQYIDGHGLSYGLYLDQNKKQMVVYDAKLAVPREIFADAVVDYDDYRMSTARAAKVVGTSIFKLTKNGWGEQELRFNGHYRYKKTAVFSYSIEEDEVLESFTQKGIDDSLLTVQHFHFPNGNKELSYSIGEYKDAKIEKQDRMTFLSKEEGGQTFLVGISDLDCEPSGKIALSVTKEPKSFFITYWKGDSELLAKTKQLIRDSLDRLLGISGTLPSMTKGSPNLQWDHELTGKGELANPKDFKTAYVIDTLPVPVINPYKSPMVLSGIAFDTSGDAYVSTMFGDVWKVSGIDENLDKIVWKRMIAGLNSPFGLTWHEGVLYVGDKAELIALHDLNGDDEFDFVERVNQEYRPMHRNVHAGAPMDSKGAFYYVTAGGVKKLFNDKVELLSPPTRTAMGIGVTHEDRVWSSPQEGDWTPASAIHEHHDGDDVYRPSSKYHKTMAEIEELLDPALVYIPRGIDNSTGGFATLRSKKFGPLGDKMLSLSYGACASMMVLRDKPNGAERFQGAIIPLEGNYISGLRYGVTNPIDGQAYLVGHDGWGTYAVSDGCLQRLRYTGEPVFYPQSFRVYENGVRLTFAERIDEESAQNIENFLAKQWNYKYSNAYGSPEFSVKYPEQQGHDVLTVKSSHLLEEGKTLFVEIPDIDPAMTVHLFGKLKGMHSQDFEVNIFMTALFLEKAFTGFPGYQSPNTLVEKQEELSLPIMIVGLKDKKISNEVRQKSTIIEATMNDALKFVFDEPNLKRLNNIKVGDSVIFRLTSTASADGMAHNALIINKEDAEEIGNFSDLDSSSISARKNSYVPLHDKKLASKVHAHSTLIGPQETKEFVYEAKTKGDKTLICTFPGHWRIMFHNFTVR